MVGYLACSRRCSSTSDRFVSSNVLCSDDDCGPESVCAVTEGLPGKRCGSKTRGTLVPPNTSSSGVPPLVPTATAAP